MSNKFKIPGLSFSWKRALGITKVKQQIARSTGIPITKAGLERKIGRTITKGIEKNNQIKSPYQCRLAASSNTF